jgi:hypothetical protein
VRLKPSTEPAPAAMWRDSDGLEGLMPQYAVVTHGDRPDLRDQLTQPLDATHAKELKKLLVSESRLPQSDWRVRVWKDHVDGPRELGNAGM